MNNKEKTIDQLKTINQLTDALSVIAFDEKIRAYLQEHDPKALKQVEKAIEDSEVESLRLRFRQVIQNGSPEEIVTFFSYFKGSSSVRYVLKTYEKYGDFSLDELLSDIMKGIKKE
jgi:hypothetical protein